MAAFRITLTLATQDSPLTPVRPDLYAIDLLGLDEIQRVEAVPYGRQSLIRVTGDVTGVDSPGQGLEGLLSVIRTIVPERDADRFTYDPPLGFAVERLVDN